MSGVMVLSDGKTPVSEEKIDEYDRKENTVYHVIL